MNNMKKLFKIILVLTLICFTACSTKQKGEALLTIESLLDEAPDSALILTSAMKNKLLTRYKKVKVILYAGRVYQENGEIENALIYAMQAKEYGLKTENNALKGLILDNIGSLN